jgi:hypothetical protein
LRLIKKRIIEKLSNLNGSEFEELCCPIFKKINEDKVCYCKGLNEDGKPVGYTVDFFTNDLEIIGECGTSQEYIKKISHDIEHAKKFNKEVKKIILFTNKDLSGRELNERIKEMKNQYKIDKIEIYDASIIASFIMDNFYYIETTIKNILNEIYDEIYIYFSEKGVLEIPFDDKDIHTAYLDKANKILKNGNKLIIAGISGIGKTILAKKIAKYNIESFELGLFIRRIDDTYFEINGIKRNFKYITDIINMTENEDKLEKNIGTLLIFDDINNIENIRKILKLDFKTSKIIITTKESEHLKDVNPTCIIQLNYLNEEEKRKFLEKCRDEEIIKQVPGLPIVLKVLKNKECNDIKKTLKQIGSVTIEEKSKQIIEIYLKDILNEDYDIFLCFMYFFGIKNKIMKKLVEAFEIDLVFENMKNNFLIEEYDKYFELHDFVLDVIASKIKRFFQCDFSNEFEKSLLNLFKEELDNDDLDFNLFLKNNEDSLKKMYDKTSNEKLKKYILYFLTKNDWKRKGEWFLKEYEQFKSNLIIFEEKIDLLLLIESYEIKHFLEEKLKKEEILKKILNELEEINLSEFNKDELKQKFLHHKGKLYLKLAYRLDYKEDKKEEQKELINKAYNIFSEVNTPKSKLQLMRILLKYEEYIEESNKKFQEIFSDFMELSKNKNWENYTVIMDFYKEVFNAKHKELKIKVLNETEKIFINNIKHSLVFGLEQGYIVLAKAIENLKEEHKDIYNVLCKFVQENEKKIFNENEKYLRELGIIFGFCYLKESFYEILSKVEHSLKDFELFQYSKILYKYKDFEKAKKLIKKALKIAKANENKTLNFYYHLLAKIEFELENVSEGCENIKKALENIDNIKVESHRKSIQDTYNKYKEKCNK